MTLYFLVWNGKNDLHIEQELQFVIAFFSVAVAKSPAEIRIEPIIYQMFFFKRIEANFFLLCNIYSKSV